MAVNISEIMQVTSEVLQKKIRQLLPSQQGFGADLQASNVIVPIIDLTETASGSIVRQDLQKSWDFTTGYNKVTTGTTSIISNSGFWKIQAQIFCANNSSSGIINITDGLTSNEIFAVTAPSSLGTQFSELSQEFIVFLRPGDSISVTVAGASSFVNVWYRNIADVNGDLTNPSGFNPQ